MCKIRITAGTFVLFLLLLSMPPFISRTGSAIPDKDAPRLFEGLRPGNSLAGGKFLVSSKNLRDFMFSETVILLINYDQNGAMGVIINRPANIRISEAFQDIEELRDKTEPVYVGGPVAVHRMLLLVRSDEQPEDSHKLFDNVYLVSSLAVFKNRNPGFTKENQFRIYAGYAGWAPGQLEREVARGDWHILRADGKMIFDKAASAVWPELIGRISALEVKRLRQDLNNGGWL